MKKNKDYIVIIATVAIVGVLAFIFLKRPDVESDRVKLKMKAEYDGEIAYIREKLLMPNLSPREIAMFNAQIDLLKNKITSLGLTPQEDELSA